MDLTLKDNRPITSLVIDEAQRVRDWNVRIGSTEDRYSCVCDFC